jgi:LEA14-like dessication related protein
MVGLILVLQVLVDIIPSISIKNYDINFGLSGFTLKINLNVQNPYPFDITLKGINLNVKVGSHRFAQISTSSETKISSSSSSNITLTTKAGYSYIFEAIKSMFSSKRKVLSLEGELMFDISAPNVQSQTIRVPINLSSR